MYLHFCLEDQGEKVLLGLIFLLTAKSRVAVCSGPIQQWKCVAAFPGHVTPAAGQAGSRGNCGQRLAWRLKVLVSANKTPLSKESLCFLWKLPFVHEEKLK